MPFQIHDDNGILRCAGDLDIRSVEELRQLLSEHLNGNFSVTLDLAAVTACDTAGLQLLYSARKQAVEHGKQFDISAASPVIQNTAVMLGISLEALSMGAAGV